MEEMKEINKIKKMQMEVKGEGNWGNESHLRSTGKSKGNKGKIVKKMKKEVKIKVNKWRNKESENDNEIMEHEIKKWNSSSHSLCNFNFSSYGDSETPLYFTFRVGVLNRETLIFSCFIQRYLDFNEIFRNERT